MNEQAAYAKASSLSEGVYERLEGNPLPDDYASRNGIDSLGVLTVSEYFTAMKEIEMLWPQIAGKTVVEIGAGIGMLALQMAKFAKRVYAIEADPAWAWVFTEFLYAVKPGNLTYIFGNAQEMVGVIHADVAVVYTRSDVAGMKAIAAQFAPTVVHGPLVSFKDRYPISEEELALVERVAARLGIDKFKSRGFARADIEAALAAEFFTSVEGK